jgi:hypothetical protein
MPSIESFKIDGLAAATFTPYKADGSVDYAGVDTHCADLAAHGVRFAFSACAFARAGARTSAWPQHHVVYACSLPLTSARRGGVHAVFAVYIARTFAAPPRFASFPAAPQSTARRATQ